MQRETAYRSTPLTVEDHGTVRLHGGKELRKWHVRMEDGADGLCWTPAADDQGEFYPCPFTEGKKCAYTTKQEAGKPLKIRPIDATELDKQRIISRQACLNTAASLISAGNGDSSVENCTGLADKLFDWVMQ